MLSHCLFTVITFDLAICIVLLSCFKLFLSLDFYGCFFVLWICTILNFTVWMVPFLTSVAFDPSFSIDIAIVRCRKVYLEAVVALLVVRVALVTPLTEADPLTSDRKENFLKLGILCRDN